MVNEWWQMYETQKSREHVLLGNSNSTMTIATTEEIFPFISWLVHSLTPHHACIMFLPGLRDMHLLSPCVPQLTN